MPGEFYGRRYSRDGANDGMPCDVGACCAALKRGWRAAVLLAVLFVTLATDTDASASVRGLHCGVVGLAVFEQLLDVPTAPVLTSTAAACVAILADDAVVSASLLALILAAA